MEKKSIEEIIEKIRGISFPTDLDVVVAIGRGGIIPAAMINQKLQVAFGIIWLRYRDDNHRPAFDTPQFVGTTQFEFKDKNILIVDDVSNSQKTLHAARDFFSGAKSIKTLAVNGPADYSLYDEACFKFPWAL